MTAQQKTKKITNDILDDLLEDNLSEDEEFNSSPKKSKKLNSNNTQELLQFVIINLSEFADINYAKQLLFLTQNSAYSHLAPVIEKVIRYREENGIFPSRPYWEQKWKAIVVPDEWLPEYSYEIVAKLRTEIVYNEVNELMKGKPSSELISQIQSCLLKYAPEKVNETFKDGDSLADSLREAQERKKKRGAGLLTGTSIDKYSYGCPFGGSTVVGAKAKTGKSNWAQSVAWNAITKQGLKGIYISLEISSEALHERWYSRYLYDRNILVDNKDIIKGTMSEKDQKIFDKYLDEFQEFMKDKLCVVTQENLPELTKVELEAFLLRKDAEMGGIDFVIVDQISLLKYFTGLVQTYGGSNKTFDIINAYVRYLTVASYTLFQKKIAMILLSQIKREEYNTIEKRKPLDLAVFAESSEIERSCNVALVLRSDEQLKASNLIEIVLLLNRDGDTCAEYVPNVFIPKHCYVGSLGEELPEGTDMSQQDTSSLFNFMESVGEDEDIDDLFK